MAKTLIGTVVSDKTDKTISVKVVTHKTHPIYKKQYIQSTKFKAHDPSNEAQVGDKVSISEIPPVSRDKRFELKKVIERPLLTDENKIDADTELKEVEKVTEAKKPKTTKKSAKKEESQGEDE